MTYSSEVQVTIQALTIVILYFSMLTYLFPELQENHHRKPQKRQCVRFSGFLFDAQESIFGFTLQGTVSDVQRD